MLRPRRFEREVDPGPVQIQARKVHFDLSNIPLEWIPGHPVASSMINLFNVVLPAAEYWDVQRSGVKRRIGHARAFAERREYRPIDHDLVQMDGATAI